VNELKLVKRQGVCAENIKFSLSNEVDHFVNSNKYLAFGKLQAREEYELLFFPL
jgi:hypothetical protein